MLSNCIGRNKVRIVLLGLTVCEGILAVPVRLNKVHQRLEVRLRLCDDIQVISSPCRTLEILHRERTYDEGIVLAHE